MGYTYQELQQKFYSEDEYNNKVELEEFNNLIFTNRLGEKVMLGKLMVDKNNHIIFVKSTLSALHLMKKYNKSIGINYNVFKELNEDDIVYFEYKTRKQLKTYALKAHVIKKYGIIDSPDKNILEKQIFVPIKYWQSI